MIMSNSKTRDALRSAASATACWGLVSTAPAQIQPGDQTIQLIEVASGLVSPVQVTNAGDGSGRLFVVDQAGFIRVTVDGTDSLRLEYVVSDIKDPARNGTVLFDKTIEP